MIFADPARFSTLLFLAILGLAIAPAAARGDDPQISDGVRVLAQVGQGGLGRKGSPYMIIRQPPIYPYMPDGEPRLFDAEADLLDFFRSLPPDLQQHGLWITRAGVADLDRREDQERIARLVKEAQQKRVLMYVCMPTEHPGADLAAWECRKRSPVEREDLVRCLPRKEPYQGHPWWDCGDRAKSVVASPANIKRTDWTEDARLSDGRVIVVKRANEYRMVADAGSGFREGWLLERCEISADLPSPIVRRIEWRGSLQPVVLDLAMDGMVYLVGVPPNGRAVHEWKLPRHELYVVLRFEGGDWKRTAVDQLPASLQPNLFISSRELFIRQGKPSGHHVDLKLKSELDSNPQIDKRYRTIIRIPERQQHGSIMYYEARL